MRNSLLYIGFVIIGLGVCYLLVPPKTVDDAVRGIFACGAVFVFFGIIKELVGRRRHKEQ